MMAITLSIAFALGWIPLFVFRAEAVRDALPYYSGSERLWVRLSPIIVAAHVTVGCIAVSLVPNLPPWRAALGALVFGAAVAFWFRARLQIGPLRRTILPDQAPGAFHRHGAFGLVRNPLYFGYLLAAAAPVLVTGRWPLLASWTAAAIALAIRADQEERRLHAQLGAPYAEYCREVKRLIPYVW